MRGFSVTWQSGGPDPGFCAPNFRWVCLCRRPLLRSGSALLHFSTYLNAESGNPLHCAKGIHWLRRDARRYGHYRGKHKAWAEPSAGRKRCRNTLGMSAMRCRLALPNKFWRIAASKFSSGVSGNGVFPPGVYQSLAIIWRRKLARIACSNTPANICSLVHLDLLIHFVTSSWGCRRRL